MKILINVLYVWGLKFNAVIIQSEKVSHAIRLLFLTSFIFIFIFHIFSDKFYSANTIEMPKVTAQ